MKLAHTRPLGGHLGTKKTTDRLIRHFTWPGMGKYVKTYCQSCISCQKAEKMMKHKAPLQPLPILSEPFKRIAFDIVGPLQRTKCGHRFIFTMMDYCTKYPEAIPLRRVDAETVATAMMEIFARLGVPAEMLTDQGSVFMSSLMKRLCDKLGVTQLKTSPYHPQTDGMLERFHGTLKAMLRHTEVNKKCWDDVLPYLLFAYREAPHSVTGFSPFELLFGRHVRGPLELLKSSWAVTDVTPTSVVQFVLDTRERMQEMKDIVAEREKENKTRMKTWYDKSARHREFAEGDQVLVLLPDGHDKLTAAWHGPYTIMRKVSPVSYEIDVADRKKRKRHFHVNMLKAWRTPNGQVLEVLVANVEGDGGTLMSTIQLTEGQKKQLDDLQEKAEVLSDLPGRVDVLEPNRQC